MIHSRAPKQIHTGYKLYMQEWDVEDKEIIFPPGIGETRRNYLVSLKNAVQEDTKKLKRIILHLDRSGDVYTADTYTTAMNSFARFREERNIPLDEVDSDLMVAYETYLKSIGICPNTMRYKGDEWRVCRLPVPYGGYICYTHSPLRGWRVVGTIYIRSPRLNRWGFSEIRFVETIKTRR